MKHNVGTVLLSIGLIGLILSNGCTVSKTPSITTKSLPEGIKGMAYSQTLAVRGGTAPYTWTVAGGTLPPGMQLDPISGVISGTPMIAEHQDMVTFQVTDHLGMGAFKDLLIIINPN